MCWPRQPRSFKFWKNQVSHASSELSERNAGRRTKQRKLLLSSQPSLETNCEHIFLAGCVRKATLRKPYLEQRQNMLRLIKLSGLSFSLEQATVLVSCTHSPTS